MKAMNFTAGPCKQRVGVRARKKRRGVHNRACQCLQIIGGKKEKQFTYEMPTTLYIQQQQRVCLKRMLKASKGATEECQTLNELLGAPEEVQNARHRRHAHTITK